jgi:hypothetical protein
MNKTLTREISTKDGKYRLSLQKDMLGNRNAEPLKNRGKHDRKYNLKIREEDVALLDALAAQEGISRSILLNNLLYSILRDELESIKERDARLLLAHKADQLAHYDGLACPWKLNAVEAEYHWLIRNISRYNVPMLDVQEDNYPKEYSKENNNWHSEQYSVVEKLLEETDNE